jgi:hypothetical protein
LTSKNGIIKKETLKRRLASLLSNLLVSYSLSEVCFGASDKERERERMCNFVVFLSSARCLQASASWLCVPQVSEREREASRQKREGTKAGQGRYWRNR